ncbi:unnamed protein product, partial [Timema podura]|nr:unnamed protein product [Timema podura]
ARPLKRRIYVWETVLSRVGTATTSTSFPSSASPPPLPFPINLSESFQRWRRDDNMATTNYAVIYLSV